MSALTIVNPSDTLGKPTPLFKRMPAFTACSCSQNGCSSCQTSSHMDRKAKRFRLAVAPAAMSVLVPDGKEEWTQHDRSRASGSPR